MYHINIIKHHTNKVRKETHGVGTIKISYVSELVYLAALAIAVDHQFISHYGQQV